MEFDGNNEGSPDSVFLQLSDGTCYEFDRGILIHAVKRELCLTGSMTLGLERMLRTA